MAIVYKLTNPQNGKVYIGSTCDIKNRNAKHRGCVSNSTLPMYHDMRETGGFDSFAFEVLATFVVEDEADRDILHVAEQSYIDKHDSIANGYNTRKAFNPSRAKRKLSPFSNPKRLCESCNCMVFVGHFAKHCETQKHLANRI